MANELSSGVKVLDKALHLLDVVEVSQPVSLQELVDLGGLPRTTAYRLLTALDTHGFIRRDERGHYITGSRFATASLLQVCPPILTTLMMATGESTQLFVRRGDERLCLVSVESTAELRTIVPPGTLLTLEKGSAGRLLMGAPSGKDGWLESVGERLAGVASVSAPIVVDGVVIAAICLSGPLDRLAPSPGRKFGAAVVAAANEAANALAGAVDHGHAVRRGPE